jgi:hypothetical protein
VFISPFVYRHCLCSLNRVEWANFGFNAPSFAFGAFRPMVAFPVETAVATQPAARWPRWRGRFRPVRRFAGFRPISADFPALALPNGDAPRMRGRAKRRRGRKREIVPRGPAPAGTICAFRGSPNCPRRRGNFLANNRARPREMSCRFSRPPFCGDLTDFENWDGRKNGGWHFATG